MRRKTCLLCAFLFLLLTHPAISWSWSGEVVGITDGDTITVLHSKTLKDVKIGLYGIDTPEKGQAFSKKAKQFTSKMVYGKVVEVEPVDADRYGRTVGIVKVGGFILNEKLVREGLAWVYPDYCQWYYCQHIMQAR